MFETLIDDIRAARPKKLCTVGKFMEGLDEQDREQLERVLADEDINSQEIAMALRPHASFSGQTLARHRRRAQGNGCCCP